MRAQNTAPTKTDQELLVEVATVASRFRSAVINGDTNWIYRRSFRRSPAQQASRDLVDLLVECLRRGLIDA